MSPTFSVRPDGVPTLEQLIRTIPQYYRSQIEDDFNKLIEAGWGELTFIVVNGKINGHLVTLSRKHLQADPKK